LFERLIPANHPIVKVEHEQPVVERFENVLVEGAHAIDFDRLQMELTIKTRILERGRNLSRDSRQQAGILAAQWLPGVFSSNSQYRNRAFRRYARNEIVEASVSPELDFLDGEAADGCRIIEGNDMTISKATANRRSLGQSRWMSVPETR
jgi:hypothetical protein